MAIQDKIQQEKLKYIRLEHFLNVLRFSLAGSSVDIFESFYALLDKGLNLWFTESGYIFDEQKAFKGDVKCAVIKIRKAWDKLDFDDPKLFKSQMVKTQDDYEIAVGDLLVNKNDVERIYGLFAEERYPWALVLWPQENSDWQWFPVQREETGEFEYYVNKFASIGDLEREKHELELINPNSLTERQFKNIELNRLNQAIKQMEDETGITDDRKNQNTFRDDSITPLEKVTHHQYQSWGKEQHWTQAKAINRVISSQQSLFLDKRTAAIDLLALVNHTRQDNKGLLPDVNETFENETGYLEPKSWLLWCIDNEFYPGIELLDTVIGFSKVENNRKRLCEIAELEEKQKQWNNSQAQSLADQEIKDRKIDELKKQIHELKSFKEKPININDVDYDRKPDASDQKFLSILSVAENWAIETQQKPSEVLRQLAFAALQWIQTDQELQKAYRISGDTKFLEVSYLKSKLDALESALKNIALLNTDLTEKDIELFRIVDIFPEQFADWINRNNFKVPEFWFKDTDNDSSEEENKQKHNKSKPKTIKRLDDLEKLMLLFEKIAKANNIGFNRYALKLPKRMIYEELNKRYPNWNRVKFSTFESDWKSSHRKDICEICAPTTKEGKEFFKKINSINQ